MLIKVWVMTSSYSTLETNLLNNEGSMLEQEVGSVQVRLVGVQPVQHVLVAEAVQVLVQLDVLDDLVHAFQDLDLLIEDGHQGRVVFAGIPGSKVSLNQFDFFGRHLQHCWTK